MKRLLLISALLLFGSNGWVEEKGLECVRHTWIGDTELTFYNEYILNKEERYILIYPTDFDTTVVKYPPETSFKKHGIELSPSYWIFWTTIVDGEEVNYKFIRDGLHLIEYFPQYDDVLDCTFMDKATIMSNIRMRSSKR